MDIDKITGYIRATARPDPARGSPDDFVEHSDKTAAPMTLPPPPPTLTDRLRDRMRRLLQWKARS